MNYSRYNLLTLSLIVSIEREGSISGGAKASNLAMAAASKRLGDFEAQIGVPIFYRRSHGVELTEAGRAILNDVMNVLEDVDRLARNIAEFSSGGRGHVRLWGNPAAISDMLPEDVASFSKLHPNVAVELEERDSPETVKAVAENRADIGIFADSVNTAGLQTFIYRNDELALIVPVKHPLAKRKSVTLEDALNYPFVGLLARTPIASRLEYESARLGKSPQVKVQVRGVESMCRMISAGLGVGLVPIPAANRYMKPMQLRAVTISETWAKRELFIGVRDAEALPHAARLLLAHLRNPPAPDAE
jgi:DNA-binding transcriptional LysR family regulator